VKHLQRITVLTVLIKAASQVAGQILEVQALTVPIKAASQVATQTLEVLALVLINAASQNIPVLALTVTIKVVSQDKKADSPVSPVRLSLYTHRWNTTSRHLYTAPTLPLFSMLSLSHWYLRYQGRQLFPLAAPRSTGNGIPAPQWSKQVMVTGDELLSLRASNT
jgi:hypothetical protein